MKDRRGHIVTSYSSIFLDLFQGRSVHVVMKCLQRMKRSRKKGGGGVVGEWWVGSEEI